MLSPTRPLHAAWLATFGAAACAVATREDIAPAQVNEVIGAGTVPACATAGSPDFAGFAVF
jgi:hypothetical protein